MFIVLIINRPVKVDLRERYLVITRQNMYKRDNALVDIDFIIYFKVVDRMQSVLNVQNFDGAATGILLRH